MTKSEILQIFTLKGILTKNQKKKCCWKNYWDEECEIIFNKYKEQYRSEEEAWFCLLYDVEPNNCIVCGKPAKFTGNLHSPIKGFNTVCEHCSANSSYLKIKAFKTTISKRDKEDVKKIVDKRKSTNIERYGVPNYMCYGTDSFKSLMFDRYGDEFYNNREKFKQTCLERYGCSTNLIIQGVRERAEIVKRIKYGSSNNLSKIKQTCLERYGVKFISQVKEFQIKAQNSKQNKINIYEITHNCSLEKHLVKKYGQGWKSLKLPKIIWGSYRFISNEYIPLIEDYINSGCYSKNSSKKEKELLKFIRSIYTGKIIENDHHTVKLSSGRFYDLDIYLPELNLAIEFNGDYWHSTINKDINYHHQKSISCYKAGVQLIHIYEYDWDFNKNYIKSMLKEICKDKFSGVKYGQIPIELWDQYILSEPQRIYLNKNRRMTNDITQIKYIIYNEGKFIKKDDL